MEAYGWDVKRGDHFEFGGNKYEAIGTPDGQHNSYVRVILRSGGLSGTTSVCMIPSGEKVTITNRPEVNFGTKEEVATVCADQLEPGVLVDGYRFGRSNGLIVESVRPAGIGKVEVTALETESGEYETKVFRADRPMDVSGRI